MIVFRETRVRIPPEGHLFDRLGHRLAASSSSRPLYLIIPCMCVCVCIHQPDYRGYRQYTTQEALVIINTSKFLQFRNFQNLEWRDLGKDGKGRKHAQAFTLFPSFPFALLPSRISTAPWPGPGRFTHSSFVRVFATETRKPPPKDQ